MNFKIFLVSALCAMTCWSLSSCGNAGSHEHHDHEHDHEHSATEVHSHDHDHDHSHDGHDHSHDGHDHSAHNHDAHDHASENHNHAAEAPHGHDHHDHGADAHAEGGSSDEIVLTPEKAAASGVKVETIHHGEFSYVLPVSGQVTAVPGASNAIVANVSGIVTYSYEIVEGAKVTAGAPLFFISSNGIQDGDPVLKAQIEYENAKSEYERAELLVADRIVSRKEYESLKSRYETARINYEALAADTQSGKTAVKTANKGYIEEILVRSGEYVTVGQTIATVTDHSKLYLRADVSEKYLGQLKDVESANFILSYSENVYNVKDLGGRLVAYGRATSEASAFVPVTFVFDGNDEILPGAFAEVYLLGRNRQDVLALPVTALTEEQDKYFIYIQLDPSCYRKQEVTLGASDGERVEILSGLECGTRVVTEGALHVKLASASNSIPGHTHNH